MTDEEREQVKRALLDLIEECRDGGAPDGASVADRTVAATTATQILLLF